MSISRLECLSFQVGLHTDLSADHDYDLVLRHEVHPQPNRATVDWQLHLGTDSGVACEFSAQYRLTFEEAGDHAWPALEASWPYLRQRAEAFLAAHGLSHLLPVDLPLSRPEVPGSDAPRAAPAVPTQPPPSEALPARVLPLPVRLSAVLGLQATLQRIVHGEAQWLMSAAQLYAALLGASRTREKGATFEWHSRNEELKEAYFQRVTGISLTSFQGLERADRRMLLSTARQTVAALLRDVLTRYSDASTGQLMDSYQDDVDDLFDPLPDSPLPEDGSETATAVAIESAERTEASDFSELYDYVVAPLETLGKQKQTSIVDGIPLLNGESIRMGSTTTLREGAQLDILSVTMVITDAGDLFEDPDPLSDEVPLREPTMYRLRYLHLDQSQEPPLLLVIDLNLDEEVAAIGLERLEDDFTDEQLARWQRSRELSERPWPPSDEATSLKDLGWSQAPQTLPAFETWLREQPEGALTAEQWHTVIHLEGLDLQSVVRDGRLPADTLTALAEHPDEAVRREVAEQPVLPPSIMEQLWNDTDEVRTGLADNPALPESLQRRLAHVESVVVRAQLACNPGLLPELLTFLAEDPFYPIRGNVAWNPATPTAVLRQLAEDQNSGVQEDAQAAMAART